MQPIPGLACPACRGQLQESPAALSCMSCSKAYRIIDGIPSFLPDAAVNPSSRCDLSIIIPASSREAEQFIRDLRAELQPLQISYEILMVAGAPEGYGAALRRGFAQASGEYVITMDADGSHDPAFLPHIWNQRLTADVVIASRYVPGGRAEMPRLRRALSRLLNAVYRRGLSLPYQDISSGFRLYHRRTLEGLSLQSNSYDILQEILIRIMSAGYTIVEMPFHYRARVSSPDRRLTKIAFSSVKTLASMWKLRNSIASADYDARAYDSIVPLQRYWQRKRYQVVTKMAAGASDILDVGCGSSRIIGSGRLVGLDIALGKLRYARRYGNPLVQGSIFELPFRNQAFDCVICSEVIEHVPADERLFEELERVLKPGGRLILGTPDYSRWRWRALESLYRRISPGGYADEHITQYSRANLSSYLASRGMALDAVEYVGGSEMIFCLRKATTPVAGGVALPATAGLHIAR